jgi:hypothetical protein
MVTPSGPILNGVIECGPISTKNVLHPVDFRPRSSPQAPAAKNVVGSQQGWCPTTF